MACGIKPFWMVLALLVVSNLQHCAEGAPQVPCFFIFGDSLADNGNNNDLSTSAKVNYRPYGIDFPGGPTGRFTNGRTTVDIIAELLGFDKRIPAFATVSGTAVLQGLNYASGSSGILDESGQQLGVHISLNGQLKNHAKVVDEFSKANQAATLNKCIYSVGMGSNDYINNYFMPQFFNSSKQFTPEQFAGVLIKQYSQQLKSLYNSGAKKFALTGLGQIGCTPSAIALFGKNGACADNLNNAVTLFNNQLKSLVDQLNRELTDAKFIYINVMGMSGGGFTVSNAPCCQVKNDTGLCVPNSTPCPNRSQFLFWDAFHPTEAANVITAGRSYSAANPADAYPFDIKHLAQS